MPRCKKKAKAKSFARLDAFLRGLIYGMFLKGAGVAEIIDKVKKPDGSSPCRFAVEDVIKKCKKATKTSDPRKPSNAGRPRGTTTALDRKIIGVVFKYRGKACVTTKFIRKLLKEARKVSLRLLQRRLIEAGLAWMRRRRKTLVLPHHKVARIAWAQWVLTRNVLTLSRWMYTDGTVFY